MALEILKVRPVQSSDRVNDEVKGPVANVVQGKEAPPSVVGQVEGVDESRISNEKVSAAYQSYLRGIDLEKFVEDTLKGLKMEKLTEEITAAVKNALIKI